MTRITGEKAKQIFETNTYAQFSPIEENRVINNSHLNDLTDAIELRDLGKSVPIIVNEKGEIYDGHHRFKAREGLGLPIYYVNHPDLVLTDVTLLNVKRRNWTYEEYGNFYSKLYVKTKREQYEHYPAFLDYRAQFNLSPTQALAYFSLDKRGTRVNKNFKSGTLTCPDYQKSVELATFIEGVVRSTGPTGAKKSMLVGEASFLAALWFIFDVPEIENTKLVTTVSEKMNRFHPRIKRNTSEWVQFIEDEMLDTSRFPGIKGKDPLWLTMLARKTLGLKK